MIVAERDGPGGNVSMSAPHTPALRPVQGCAESREHTHLRWKCKRAVPYAFISGAPGVRQIAGMAFAQAGYDAAALLWQLVFQRCEAGKGLEIVIIQRG